jgi:hypothetical protein
MLVLLWTPVAIFRLSGDPMTRDDLRLVTRIQSAAIHAASREDQLMNCAHTGGAMIAVLSS